MQAGATEATHRIGQLHLVPWRPAWNYRRCRKPVMSLWSWIWSSSVGTCERSGSLLLARRHIREVYVRVKKNIHSSSFLPTCQWSNPTNQMPKSVHRHYDRFQQWPTNNRGCTHLISMHVNPRSLIFLVLSTTQFSVFHLQIYAWRVEDLILRERTGEALIAVYSVAWSWGLYLRFWVDGKKFTGPNVPYCSEGTPHTCWRGKFDGMLQS